MLIGRLELFSGLCHSNTLNSGEHNMTERPLGAQISHYLKSRDVDVIFGIPGVHNQGLYRGLRVGITHILGRHGRAWDLWQMDMPARVENPASPMDHGTRCV